VSLRRRPHGQSPHGLSGRRRLVGALELVDDRFEKLASELRASRPVSSEGLRERVGSLGAAEPESPRWTFRLPTRRVALGLVAAALLTSFVVAGVTGLNGSDKRRASTGAAVTKLSRAPTTDHESTASGLRLTGKEPVFGGAELAPNARRLQRYDAMLRIRVKDVDALSNAARRAMNLTRSLGGYVASVNYATRGGERGGATLVLRVPVLNIQTALGKLTGLGTILGQQTGILDVTKRADRESRQIARLERQLAEASPEEAPAIRLKLKTLRAKHAKLVRSARLARITLSLTTPAKQAAPSPSRFDRTLDDAGSVLVRELEILLYTLIVAGPLVLLGAAGVLAGRRVRRQADSRLLNRI
jgi:hypothetical protein